jgi:hypothetical protein
LPFGLTAQTPSTRAGQIQQQRAELAKIPVAPDTDRVEQTIKWVEQNGALRLFSRGWKGLTPAIGGMINGSGFAGGLQFLQADFRDGAYVLRSSARVSTKEYQFYDLEMGLPRLANDHVFLDFYARHRNYA